MQENSASGGNRTANMTETKARGGRAEEIRLEEILALLPKSQREKIISGYDVKSFAKIFEDGAMMSTVEAFLQNGMNVTRTAEITYMHRNTLTYRINSIKKLTGLDLRDFNQALTFKLLHMLYVMG